MALHNVCAVPPVNPSSVAGAKISAAEKIARLSEGRHDSTHWRGDECSFLSKFREETRQLQDPETPNPANWIQSNRPLLSELWNKCILYKQHNCQGRWKMIHFLGRSIRKGGSCFSSSTHAPWKKREFNSFFSFSSRLVQSKLQIVGSPFSCGQMAREAKRVTAAGGTPKTLAADLEL